MQVVMVDDTWGVEEYMTLITFSETEPGTCPWYMSMCVASV